jgi:hypothetical protein
MSGTLELDFDQARTLDHELMEAYMRARVQPRRFSPARLYLVSHVGRQMQRLREAYVGLAQVASDTPELHDWLKKRANDLEAFIGTLKSPSSGAMRLFRSAKKGWTAAATAYVVLPALLGLPAGVAGISAIVLSGLHSCFCEMFRWIHTALVLSILVIGVFGFSWYREVLLGTRRASGGPAESPPNVYELEQRLLRVLGVRRRGEVQWDVVAWFVIAAEWVAAIFLASSFHGDRQLVFPFYPWIMVGVFVGLGVISALLSAGRKWGWRPTL